VYTFVKISIQDSAYTALEQPVKEKRERERASAAGIRY
jgi:hypothetical protein